MGNKKEKRKFYFDPRGNATHNLFIKSDKFIEISTITLKNIFEENNLKKCSLLKIDCEGAEYEIFESATSDLLKKIKIICMEYHPNGNPLDIKLKLEKNGFEVLIKKSTIQGIGYIYAQNKYGFGL